MSEQEMNAQVQGATAEERAEEIATQAAEVFTAAKVSDPIADTGTFTEAETKQIEDFAKQINIRDTRTILNYGGGVQKKAAQTVRLLTEDHLMPTGDKCCGSGDPCRASAGNQNLLFLSLREVLQSSVEGIPGKVELPEDREEEALLNALRSDVLRKGSLQEGTVLGKV